MAGRDLFNRYEKIICFAVKLAKCFPKKIRQKKLETARYRNGKLGIVVRYIWLASLAKKCGKNVAVFPMCLIKSPENLVIGDNVSIQSMCVLACAGGIDIGNNVSIAYGTTVLSTTHTFDSVEVPIKYQPIELKHTRICDDVWIGCNATIIGGSVVNEGCVVGANSTVTKDIPAYSVAAGSPARIIKVRGKILRGGGTKV